MMRSANVALVSLGQAYNMRPQWLSSLVKLGSFIGHNFLFCLKRYELYGCWKNDLLERDTSQSIFYIGSGYIGAVSD